MHTGYVITEDGEVYLQGQDDNQWGFSVFSYDQSWPGGFIAGNYTCIADNDPRITDEDRESLEWLLDQLRESSTVDTESGEYEIYHYRNSGNPDAHDTTGGQWFFEPLYYAGGTVYSSGYPTKEDARAAALAWGAQQAIDAHQ